MKAGQLLVELDATNASADGASVREQLSAAISEERRTAALTKALEANRPPVMDKPVQATEAHDNAQLQAEWADISARLARLAAEQSHRQAEITTVRELINKLVS